MANGTLYLMLISASLWLFQKVILLLSYRREILDITLIYNALQGLNDYMYRTVAQMHKNNLRHGHEFDLVSVKGIPKKIIFLVIAFLSYGTSGYQEYGFE